MVLLARSIHAWYSWLDFYTTAALLACFLVKSLLNNGATRPQCLAVFCDGCWRLLLWRWIIHCHFNVTILHLDSQIGSVKNIDADMEIRNTFCACRSKNSISLLFTQPISVAYQPCQLRLQVIKRSHALFNIQPT
jgi:hypothetical protein